VDRKNALDCFNLDDERVFDNDIHAVTTIEADILVNDRERYLAPVCDPGLSEFET